MPNYAIARHAKLKGGGVSSSSHHNLRTRETPNADEARGDKNRILYGDDRPLREKVDEKTSKTAAKTRSDNVECVEYMLTGTREHFLDSHGEIDDEKLEKWIALNLEFLHEECGQDLIGAILHMDETTPHIAAYRVPLKDGKLNCKYFYGTRALNSRFQDRYADKMKVLGLERGIERSRARHQDIKRFYASINAPVKLNIRTQEIADPPRLFISQTQQKEYKETVVQEVMTQVEPQITAIRDKALTAEDEKRKRVAAETRAVEKIVTAEKARELAEARQFVGTKRNQALHKEVIEFREQNEQLSRALTAQTQKLDRESARVRDIPLTEVMSRLGCEGHPQPDHSTVYLSNDGREALSIKNNRAYDSEGELAAKNAIQLFLHISNEHFGQNASHNDGLNWLADNFGEKQAVAAHLAHQEEVLSNRFGERQRDRNAHEKKEQSLIPTQRSEQQSFLETAEPEIKIEDIGELFH